MKHEATNNIQQVLIAFYEKRDMNELVECFCDDIAFYGCFSETSSEGREKVIEELHKEIQLFPMANVIKNMDIHVMDLKEDLVSICVSYEVENGADKKALSYHLSSVSVLIDGKWKIKMLHNSFSDVEQKELMERMRQTVIRYHEAIADTDISIWYYDMKKKCIMQDGNSYNIHGFSHVIENVPESLISVGYVHPDDVESFRAMYDKMFSGEEFVSGDFWVRQTKENAYWCEQINYKVIFDEEGTPVMALGSSKDVSLEKENERRYKQELSYKTALQKDGVGSYILNLKGNEIISANERKEVFQLLENAKTVDEFFQNCLKCSTFIVDHIDITEIWNREKLLEGFRESEKTIQYETEYRKNQDQTLWLQWTLRVLKNPQTEELIAFLYIEDVTAERTLQKIMDIVIKKDYDYVELVDTQTEECIRYFDAKMIKSKYGYTGNDIFSNREEATKVLSLDNIVRRLDEQDNFEYSCECYDEEGRKVYKQWRFWYMSRRRNKIIFVKSDITALMAEHEKQKKLLEGALKQEESASKAKGSFLSNMSHEIRTPLNAILGYLSIATDQDATEEKKDYCLENCKTASEHLLRIINDVLDMSSIENGKLKIAQEEFNLKKEVEDITSIFYQNAKQKHVNFETHIGNVTEEWIIGDQLRLNQILMNLLSNAVKFTPENGNVCFTVEQLRKDDKRVYMKFVVQDTGIGMSEDYMSRIFHPFEQENAGTAKKYGGSGLGLSITNNLIHMMSGKIEVSSKQNEGTCFTVTMFFDRSKEHHEEIGTTDYSKVRVLVVDDQEEECSYVKSMLKNCGVKADTITSSEKGLRRIRSRAGGEYAYDLCIIDWKMPDMNGCEMTQKIRTELGEEMPIIIVTAYDVAEIEAVARQAGANKVVSKPLFQSKLFDMLVSTFGSYDPKASQKNGKQIDMTGVHILLAEDNPMNMDIAVTIMEKVGIIVDQAHDGQEAIERFLKEEPGTYDLILMDIQMPIIDGYEATGIIRKSSHPEADTIPIVAMTANAFAEDVTEALSRGMNAHIAKPIDYDKLFSILEKFSRRI